MLVLSGTTFWGVGGTVAQRLFQEDGIAVGWLVSVRLLIAGIVMVILALLTKDKNKVLKIWRDRKAVVQLVIFGVFGMLAVQYTYMASIDYGNAAVATLLQYLAPIFILLYLVLAKGNRLQSRDVIAVVLALTGTALLLTNGSFSGLLVPVPAVFWGVLSGLALAFYTLYAGQLLTKWGSLNVIGWAMIIGGACLGIVYPPWQVDVGSWGVDTVLFLGFVVLFGTMLAFWFYLESLKYLKPQETSLLGSMEPLSAVVTSVLWLHVPYGVYQMLGTCLILGMVIYLSVFKDKKKVPEPVPLQRNS